MIFSHRGSETIIVVTLLRRNDDTSTKELRELFVTYVTMVLGKENPDIVIKRFGKHFYFHCVACSLRFSLSELK